MAFVSKIILFLAAVIFPFGQLLRINLHNFSFPIIDIFIVLLAIFNLFYHFKKNRLKVKNKAIFYFILIAWVSFGLNFLRYHIISLTPFFYLIRLTCLMSFFIYPINFKNQKFSLFFNLAIISNIIFGLIQYFFWPDFTYFNSQNWDPHLYRLVSSFFDPTFTAFIYLSFLIYIYLNPKISYRWPLIIITYVALALTYSRSSYIAFLAAFSFIAIKQKRVKVFIFSLLLIISTIFLLPRQEGEGTKLERTSSIKAKIENYQEGIKTFIKSPIIGHGYNNLAFVRDIKIKDSHANNGFDSSLITILTTTGIIGLVAFLLGFKTYFNQSDLTHQTIFLALLIHSLFANSLLYPFTLLFLFLI